MATIKPYISSVVSKQLPEFVREDYATFVSFLEAYYEYLDTNDYAKRNLKDLRDIDDTLESFVQYFKNEYNCALNSSFDNCATVNDRLILSKLKQYYNAKGSEKAFQFLFRLLYNKDIGDVFYPSTVMLRASDGKWQQDISFFLEVTDGDADDIVGKEITISNGTITVKVFVERVVNISGDIYEVFVQRFNGIFSVGYEVTYSTIFEGVVTGTTATYSVLTGGGGFTVGQIYDINSADGSGTKIKITQVDSSGAIEKLQIVQFGTGYTTDFIATLSPVVTDFTDPSPISVSLNGNEQFEVPSSTYTNGFTETGYITLSNYWSDTYSDGTYVGTEVSSFISTVATGVDTTKVASIKFFIGSVANYPGYYSKNDGFISDSIYIQDSFYYQAFSYVIRIDEQLNSYKNILKSYIHPSGMALFADYQINNTFDLSSILSATELQVRLYLSDSTSVSDSLVKTISKPLSDSQSISDGGTALSVTKVLSDSQSISDDGTVLSVTKVLSDSQSMTDNGTVLDVSKQLDNDFEVVTDALALSKSLETFFSDSQSIADNLIYDLNKDTITESISESDSGSILLNPYTEGFYFAEDYVDSESPVATF